MDGTVELYGVCVCSLQVPLPSSSAGLPLPLFLILLSLAGISQCSFYSLACEHFDKAHTHARTHTLTHSSFLSVFSLKHTHSYTLRLKMMCQRHCAIMHDLHGNISPTPHIHSLCVRPLQRSTGMIRFS